MNPKEKPEERNKDAFQTQNAEPQRGKPTEEELRELNQSSNEESYLYGDSRPGGDHTDE